MDDAEAHRRGRAGAGASASALFERFASRQDEAARRHGPLRAPQPFGGHLEMSPEQ